MAGSNASVGSKHRLVDLMSVFSRRRCIVNLICERSAVSVLGICCRIYIFILRG